MEKNDSISMLLDQTANAFGTYASKQLQPHGLTHSQARVLCHLVNTFGGSCFQGQLKKEIGISAPALSGMLLRLEKCGFITRFEDPMDTRKNLVYASWKATQCVPVLTACLEACEKQALIGLKEAEIAQLKKVFRTIHFNCTDSDHLKGAEM